MRMLTGYFDESGHSGDPRCDFVGMAGFVAPYGAWKNLEERWSAALEHAGFHAPFHMKEFAHSVGQFEKWKDPSHEPERRALFAYLIELILETGAKPIGAAISMKDFGTLTEEQRKYFLDPYYFAFQTCTRGAAIQAVWEPPEEKVSTVYAFNGEFGASAEGRAEQLWRFVRENYDHGHRLGSYASASPSDLCALQAADLFAYELCHEFENQIKRPHLGMRWGLRKILCGLVKVIVPSIRRFDRKELLRTMKESNWPDRTGFDEVEDTAEQMQTAKAKMGLWLLERAGWTDPTDSGTKPSAI